MVLKIKLSEAKANWLARNRVVHAAGDQWLRRPAPSDPWSVVFRTRHTLGRRLLVRARSSVLSASVSGAKDKSTEGDPREQDGYAYVIEALEAGLKTVERFV